MKKTLASILIIAISIAVLCTNSLAYTTNGYHITNTLSFTPYYAFGSTTISHFNEALWQWNSNSGEPLMNRKATIRHYSTNYPSNDNNCYIYAVNTGTGDYVAQTHYYTSGSVMVAPDINMNMYYSWANSAQPNAYDVWSVFLHEAGHAAGLSHSSSSSAVMYKYVYKNTLRRYLSTDDINGIQSIYASINVNPNSNTNPDNLDDQNTEYISGCLKEYSNNDLINNATLVVKARLNSISDSFKIKPVFDGDPQIYTDYYFDIENVLLGEYSDSKPLTVRVQGGTIGEEKLIVEEAPKFSEKDEVLLFLYQPNMGGGYNTRGDYYYILGVNQGAFFKSKEMQVYKNEDCSLAYEKLSKELSSRTVDRKTYSRVYDEFVENNQYNFDNGVITAKDYNRMIDEVQRYATILS